MIKKITKIFITTFLIIYLTTPLIQADDINENTDDNIIKEQILETSANQENIPIINSRAAVVIDRNSNTILYGKNENDKRKMASTTKIMTSLLIIENCYLNDVVEISKKAAGTGGSRLGLKTGDKITVNDLLYGLMLCSGNDTAVALAEHLGNSVENFADLMNKKAKEIGLKNTNFVTPHGLDSDEHYTTAYELALLSNIALNNETFAKIVNTKSYTVTINGYSKTITNTNELLGNLNGVYGIKTGFTNGANRCLVTACKRNNLDIICVVLGADTKKFRTNDSIKLIEYCFKTFISVDVEEIINSKFIDWKNNNIKNFNIVKGTSNNISIKYIPLKYPVIPIKKELLNKLTVNIHCKTNFEAPIVNNTQVGHIDLYCGNEPLINTQIIFDCNIQRKNILNYFTEFWKYNIGKLNKT